MIYIVEIPHQHQPFCWSAVDEEDAISRMWVARCDTNSPQSDESFAEWLRYNRLDLYRQYVFMEARAAILGLKEVSGYGTSEAIKELRRELVANGELPEEPSDDR